MVKSIGFGALAALVCFSSCKSKSAVENAQVAAQTAPLARPPQHVMLAFDGSYNLNFWKEARAWAAKDNVKFTVFMSCVYFLDEKSPSADPDLDKMQYMAPKKPRGKSAIGWGDSPEDVKLRVQQLKETAAAGHELQSHACSHFGGGDLGWTEQDWDSEFDQYEKIMAKVSTKFGYPELPKPTGFRAPLLSITEGMWPVLKKRGFVYDTSLMSRSDYWPKRNKVGSWNFPLAQLLVKDLNNKPVVGANGAQRTVPTMDYNFFAMQSKGVEQKDEAKTKEYEEQMFRMYMSYFNSNYYGNRAPVHIGHHFSQWNKGAYWHALQRFADAVCKMPEVQCGKYGDLVNFMNTNESNIAALQAGNFPKMKPAVASMSLDEDLKTPITPEKTSCGEETCPVEGFVDGDGNPIAEPEMHGKE
jgi:peptidoglycan/xylan/chitin deacetylase (PgdA/CDA1 family)